MRISKLGEEKLYNEIKDFLKDKGIEQSEENIKEGYKSVISQMENPYYNSPCEDCDNSWCKTVDRIWYCSNQR